VLLDPGAVVAVVEPGYPPVVELLRAQGLHVVGVPVDDQGIVVDAIPARARLVYVTPSHQYPLGVVMTRRRRLELLDWAGSAGAAIIEDDYDSEFRHTARPLEPLQRLDRDGRVIYVGTFSKTLSPALRLGLLVAPKNLIPRNSRPTPNDRLVPAAGDPARPRNSDRRWASRPSSATISGGLSGAAPTALGRAR
jgi:GntR family transcriptional regulator/MocR family aminotransferase